MLPRARHLALVLVTALALTVTLSAQSAPPHTVDVNGQRFPDSGYSWVDPTSSDDFRVKWTPGRPHRDYPNVVAGDKEGQFRPADGYDWVDPDAAGDFRVRPEGSAAAVTPPTASPAVTLISSAAPTGTSGRVVSAFASAWGSNARVSTTADTPATAPADAMTRALAELQRSPADGSVLAAIFFGNGTAKPVLAQLAALRPIAVLGQTNTSDDLRSYVGLFAPAATPAARVQALASYAAQVAAGNDFRDRLDRIVRVANDNPGTLTRLLSTLQRDALPAPLTALPARGLAAAPLAPTPPATQRAAADDADGNGIFRSRGNAGGFPLGIKAGNLYFFERCDTRYGQPGDARFCYPVMSAGASTAEALAVMNQVERTVFPGDRPILYTWTLLAECEGATWGASVYHADEDGERRTWGAGCGASPAAALRVAGGACERKRGAPCSYRGPNGMVASHIRLGHSGERMAQCVDIDNCAQFPAFAGNVSGNLKPVLSADDAIRKLGQMCDTVIGARIPCFTTFRNWNCTMGPGGEQCVDYRYTADGIEPYRPGERQPAR